MSVDMILEQLPLWTYLSRHGVAACGVSLVKQTAAQALRWFNDWGRLREGLVNDVGLCEGSTLGASVVQKICSSRDSSGSRESWQWFPVEPS